jgi:primary-amine oxidase
MPVEPMTLLLRPRNFFTKNPALDVPPSYCSTPSQAKNKAQGLLSRVVVAGGEAEL